MADFLGFGGCSLFQKLVGKQLSGSRVAPGAAGVKGKQDHAAWENLLICKGLAGANQLLGGAAGIPTSLPMLVLTTALHCLSEDTSHFL